MTKLWMPGDGGQYGQEMQRITIPPIEVPQHLQEDLWANPGTEELFYAAVKKALDQSFNDPTTSMREPTAQAIHERIEACYEAVVAMRNDMKYALRKCFSLLPDALCKALREGSRVDDKMAETSRQVWAGPGKREDVLIDEDIEGEIDDDCTPLPGS